MRCLNFGESTLIMFCSIRKWRFIWNIRRANRRCPFIQFTIEKDINHRHHSYHSPASISYEKKITRIKNWVYPSTTTKNFQVNINYRSECPISYKFAVVKILAIRALKYRNVKNFLTERKRGSLWFLLVIVIPYRGPYYSPLHREREYSRK